MRSIVAVFAVALAACGPFGAMSDGSEADVDDTPAKKATDDANDGDANDTPKPNTNTNGDTPSAPDVSAVPGVVEQAQTEEFKQALPGSKLFAPDPQGPTATPGATRAGLVILHGSEGGLDTRYIRLAQEQAAKGFVTIALCWSNCPSGSAAPPDVQLPGGPVDLSRISAAAGFLRKPELDTTKKVGVFGFDQGGEAALLVASKLGTQQKDIGFDAYASYAGTDKTRSAWLVGGQVVPAGTLIPVAQYKNPVFIAHGSEDHDWLFTDAEKIRASRDKAGDFLLTDIQPILGQGHVVNDEGKTQLSAMITFWFQEMLSE